MKRVFVISMQEDDFVRARDRAELCVHHPTKESLLESLEGDIQGGSLPVFIDSIPEDGLSAEDWPERGVLVIEGVIRVPRVVETATKLELD